MEQDNFNVSIPKKRSTILKWALVLGIVIVSNLFLVYAIDVFYDEPKYENFCEEKQVQIIPETQDECVAVGGRWTEDRYIQKDLPRPEEVSIPVIETQRKGWCDPDYTCREEFSAANTTYNRDVFIILVIVGVAMIIGSLFIAAYDAVSLGVSLAGVLSLVIGTVRYWSDMDEYLRVIVLGIALAALIWVGIKRFKD